MEIHDDGINITINQLLINYLYDIINQDIKVVRCMELVILAVLLIIVFSVFKKFHSVIYFIVIVDIFLRIATFVKQNITIPEVYTFLNKYIPLSIPNMIDKYLSGILNEILIWAYVGIFIIFEHYIIKTFLKKK